MRIKKTTAIVFVLGILTLSLVVFALPEGPESITRGESSRKSLDSTGNSQQAAGGNMTVLIIGGERISRRWQGFYGNITGGVSLATADNYTLYSWGIANPEGEIYAANHSTVEWGNIDCVNFSTNTSVLRYNVTQMNEFIGYTSEADQSAKDSVNATFNQTYGDDGSSFSVGSVTIDNAANCSMVTLNNGSGYQTDHFKEVLLTDNESIVFAAIIETDQSGFSNASLDFQMIVGVNGTDEDTTKDYYFYIELS